MLAKESCIQFQKWDLINHTVKLQLTDHKLFCLVLNFQTSKVIVMFESVVSCHIKCLSVVLSTEHHPKEN